MKEEKFISKLNITQLQYEYCSELIWGHIFNRKEGEETLLFLSKYKNLLLNYKDEEEKEWKNRLKKYIDNRKYKFLYENGIGYYQYEE